MMLLIPNLWMTNSRTAIVVVILGVIVFVAMSLSFKLKFKLVLVLFYSMLFLSNTREFEATAERVYDIVRPNGGLTSGSSLDMRTLQLSASLNEFLKRPVFGNGLYFINEDLGWDKNPENRTSEDDFEGFESYIYHLLIERGLVGIVANCFFFLALVWYFFKRRAVNTSLSSIALAISIMFITFIVATGTLGSWAITFTILGLIIRHLEFDFANDKISDV
jgi:O-antigen ligase